MLKTCNPCELIEIPTENINVKGKGVMKNERENEIGSDSCVKIYPIFKPVLITGHSNRIKVNELKANYISFESNHVLGTLATKC